MIRPHLICIGATKAGTSWLFRNLSSRSDVWASPFKEINMMTSMFQPETLMWTHRQLLRQIANLNLAGGERVLGINSEDYLQYISELKDNSRLGTDKYDLLYKFAPENKLCIDISPSYATLPEGAVQYISEGCPDAKFLYIIRDPFERAKSQLRMHISRRYKTPGSLSEWMSFACQPEVLDSGNYQVHLPKWEHVLADRIMCLPFGLIRTDPLSFLLAVELFANLESSKYPLAKKKIHKTKEIVIPKDVESYLKAKTLQSSEYVKSKFGVEFWNASL